MRFRRMRPEMVADTMCSLFWIWTLKNAFGCLSITTPANSINSSFICYISWASFFAAHGLQRQEYKMESLRSDRADRRPKDLPAVSATAESTTTTAAATAAVLTRLGFVDLKITAIDLFTIEG